MNYQKLMWVKFYVENYDDFVKTNFINPSQKIKAAKFSGFCFINVL